MYGGDFFGQAILALSQSPFSLQLTSDVIDVAAWEEVGQGVWT